MTTPTMLSRTATLIDPAAVLRVKNLELRARVVMEGFMAGLHRSPHHGFSVEFTDYRQYSPGDDLRHLDWKLLARQDRLYIKRFEDETNLRCHLVTDLSRSMSFSSGDWDKSAYTKTTAATLALFLSLQRDAVGIITFDESITDILPPRFRPGHLRRLMLCLERATGGKATDLARPLEQIVNSVNKRGLIILISDLLAPVEQVTKQLGYLRSMRHEVIILRILDPAEVDFRYTSASMFRDMESGQEIYVDPPTVAAEYRRRFDEHESGIKACCDDLGIDFCRVTTDQPLDTSLFYLLHSRVRRGRMIRRGRRGGGRS